MGTTTQHQQYPYLRNYIADRHVTRHGTIQVPVAAPDGTPPVIIKLHAKYQYRVVDFFIQEMGAEPNAPSATPQADEVLKYENTVLEGPNINMGGTQTSGQDGGSMFDQNGNPNPSFNSGSSFTANNRHIFTKRGRYVFLKTDVIQQTALKYPQLPYDDEGPLPSSGATWIPTLVGNDSAASGGTNAGAGSGKSMLDGSAIPSAAEEEEG